MNLHPAILEHIEREHADALAAPPQLNQDALTVVLRNGVTLTVRYAAPDAYSLRWNTGPGTPETGINTAPVHAHLPTYPNHLLHADGTVAADPITRSDASPEANVGALIAALARDPLLASRP
ncbi:hypothetical protein [Thauera linaloolentis]|uniref:Uncharacterized protein n=1 Tax=Thauera linaloolentis (strain DSM 12138 / JCM 21573 / CCUG 41526 / CIP 105981 / IAM 15112 / NBRC 102519 / 47Lol) TaxID=1123367 RepID=N6YTZ9_THAL4|nr:hypothetical protein [Thauera linaloolentis]ENO83419.1 hypothetical protein C666_18890 [Thauera linaloolentis 47Lol = DSM 12138]MCM8565750.1 hypothetical protein [Thauera linaloolentis]